MTCRHEWASAGPGKHEWAACLACGDEMTWAGLLVEIREAHADDADLLRALRMWWTAPSSEVGSFLSPAVLAALEAAFGPPGPPEEKG